MTRLVLALLLSLSLAAHAGVKTAGVGHFQIPTAPAAGTSVTSGAANTYTATYVQLIASTSAALYITGVHLEAAAASAATYKSVQLATGGAGSETIIGQYLVPLTTASTSALGFRPIYPPIPVANATRIAAKVADSVGSQAVLVTLEVLAQTNYVDDGVAVGTVTTVTNQLTAAQVATGVWQDTTAGDFTTALSVGKSVMNGVSLGTGLTVASVSGSVGSVTGAVGSVTGAVGSVTGAVGSVTGLTASNLDATVSSRMASYTQPTGFLAATFPSGTVANTTNITAGTIATVTTVANQLTAAQIATGVWQDATAGDFTAASSIGKSVMNGVALGTGLTVNDLTTKTGFSLAASQHVIVDSGTVTTLTNLPSIPANWLTATGINAGALNGKGDWLLSSSYTAPTNLTAAQIATGVWQDTTAGDFTTSLSVGKSVMNGVSLGTGLTVASVSGAVGSVTGAVGSVTGAVGSVTGNVGGNVSGSVGSVTGLTASNLDTTVSSRMATYTQPTGFLAATFPGTVASTTNITAATGITVATNSDKTGYTLTAGYDPAKTASQAGDAMTLTAAYNSAKTAAQAGDSMAINSTGINSIWNEALSGHTTAGTAGKVLSTAGSGADPWAITLPGAYGASSAGYIIGTYLDAAISSRAPSATALSTATWTGTRANNIDSIKAKTDSLTFSVAGKVDANAKAINGVTLTGTGASNNPWGPAP